MSQTHKGSCFCGAVELTVTGEPVAAGFCHCSSCRSWSASPVNAFSLWKPDAVKITKGEGDIGVYHKTEKSYRKFCKTCGGHLLTHHPLWGLIDGTPLRSRAIATSRRFTSTTQRLSFASRMASQDEGPAQGDGWVGRGPTGVAGFAQGACPVVQAVRRERRRSCHEGKNPS